MSPSPEGGLNAAAIPRHRRPVDSETALFVDKGVAAAWSATAQGKPITDIADVADPIAVTVLILVEDRLIRKLLSEALAFRGLRALTAAGVPEAARVLGANRPDVLVLESATTKSGTLPAH